MQFLKRLMPKKHRFSGEILPDEPFVAIGDVHGRADLMGSLLEGLSTSPYADLPIVFVGDYVDRGEHSSDVLRDLMARAADSNIKCLRGNHEEMLLNFLEDPIRQGARWLRYGGLQTMASFGAPNVPQTASEPEWIAARDALVDAMGAEMIDWLYGLPTLWQTGNVAVVHAGADPAQPIDMQDPHIFVWGHPKFDSDDRADGVWVVHGHTIVDNAIAEDGRVSIDTGAYATGVLSAAIITPGDVSFVIA